MYRMISAFPAEARRRGATKVQAPMFFGSSCAQTTSTTFGYWSTTRETSSCGHGYSSSTRTNATCEGRPSAASS